MGHHMTELLRHIDAIAREKNRDVLFVHFEEYDHQHPEKNIVRNDVMHWFDLQNIDYFPCMGLEGESLIDSYTGDLYLDVPFDESSPAYKTLSEYLEDEQGNMKIQGVLFFSLSLEIALEIEADLMEASAVDSEYAENEFGDQFGEGFIEDAGSDPKDEAANESKTKNDKFDDGQIGTIQ